MRSIEDIRQAIIADPENKDFTKRGIFPLFEAHETARIVLVGQAPGSRAEATGLYFRDPSGDNLRAWLGVDEEIFYESGLFAVVPMDFYFPGSGKSGDLPPRKDFADKWHEDILAQMPNVELMILIVQNLELLRVLPKTKKNKNSVIEYHEQLIKELEDLKNKL